MRARIALVGALLALAGCNREGGGEPGGPAPSSAAVSARPAPSPPVPPVPAAAPTESATELQLGELAGIWRVIGVIPGPEARFAADDRRIVGSLMDVMPDQLSWSFKATRAFAPDEVCFGPVAGLIDEPSFAQTTRKLFEPAVARLHAKAGHLSRPHQWLCGDGGSWGDDAEFQQVADGRLAMRWPGDIVLLLERVRKVSTDPPPLPPTGEFRDR